MYYSIHKCQVLTVDPHSCHCSGDPSHETAAVCSTAVPGTADQFTSHHLVPAAGQSSGAEPVTVTTTTE